MSLDWNENRSIEQLLADNQTQVGIIEKLEKEAARLANELKVVRAANERNSEASALASQRAEVVAESAATLRDLVAAMLYDDEMVRNDASAQARMRKHLAALPNALNALSGALARRSKP